MKTPQNILNQSREEFEKKFEDFYDVGVPSESEPNAGSEIIHFQELKSFLTTTLQAFIEAEIERLEGVKKDVDYVEHKKRQFDEKCICDICDAMVYNQALNDQITHFKELLVTLKR